MPPLDIPELLQNLSLEQKAAMLDGKDFWHTQDLPEDGIPAIMVTDGPHGLRKQAGEADHLGLNASVPATCFPPAAGLASSWNPNLVQQVGQALGVECQAQDVAVLLGPGVNMKRSPLCGRNFEYYSEDPLLAGTLASAFVKGVQSQGVGTSLKHFAANNQEFERMSIDAQVDERTLREIYLPAFEQVVTEAKPWTVMCSYNRLNGSFTSESKYLLTKVLREEWGFTGLVVSDWGAVNERDAALAAGLDLEMPSSGGLGTDKILQALREGKISEQQIDQSVTRVLELVNRAVTEQRTGVEFEIDKHHDLACQAATESVVLLRNEGNLLPLSPSQTVAVIGEFARAPRYQGAGSSHVNPTRLTTAWEELQETDLILEFAPGYRTDSDQTDPQLLKEAVAVAQRSEVALLFVGLPDVYESEGYDRDHLSLPPAHLELISAISSVNPRTVVILSAGSAVEVSSWHDQVPALLYGWLLGQAGGQAVAQILTGQAEPGGRLAETLPLRLQHNPSYGNFPGEKGVVRYGEGILIGYRWYDTRQLEVAYPFGFGLSYTNFSYSGLRVQVLDGNRVKVFVTVTNTGTRRGSTVVQIYVSATPGKVERAAQELRAFRKLTLDAKQQREVSFDLTPRAFSYWDVGRPGWVVPAGDYEIRVGISSRDIIARTSVTLPGDGYSEPLTAESTFEQWLRNPLTANWTQALVMDSPARALLFDSANGELMRAIPLPRLARMLGLPVNDDSIQNKLRELYG